MSDIGNFFQSLPFFTRYWFGLSIFFPLIGRFGLLNPTYMILDFNAFVRHFQIWRPVTALFYYPLAPATAFSYLLNLYFLYNYSVRLETGVFAGRPADYCFLLLFNWFSIVVLALAFNLWLLMDSMILSILYIWCQINKDVVISFWFGTRFKAIYLPWVLFGVNFLLRGGGFDELIGIMVGHLYYFLMHIYPEKYRGPSLLQTPQILYDYFPSRRGGGAGGSGFSFGQAPASRQQPNDRGQRGHSWGRGHTLGGQ